MIDSIIQWDKEVLLFFQEHIRADWLDPVMKVISAIGWKGILWIALCIVLIIIKRPEWSASLPPHLFPSVLL